MKKIILFCAIIATSIGFSQDKPATTTTTTTVTTVTSQKKPTKYFGKNEVKINALYFVLGAAELQYERILNDESSIGARTFIGFTEDVFETEPFYLDGYYRFFFGEKPAAGFFVEGLASYNTIRDYTYNYNFNTNTYNDKRDLESGFGLGIQVGGKFITRNGIVFEINGGVGRNIIDSSDENRIFGRFGISAGYRF